MCFLGYIPERNSGENTSQSYLNQKASKGWSPHESTDLRTISVLLVVLFAGLVFIIQLSPTASAQTTISSGSIQGTVTDPTGAAVSGARVTITNQATGKSESLTTNSSGSYSSGPLTPDTYKVTATGGGFRTTTGVVTVLVGNTANFNAKLELGQERVKPLKCKPVNRRSTLNKQRCREF